VHYESPFFRKTSEKLKAHLEVFDVRNEMDKVAASGTDTVTKGAVGKC
jgi:hypothetical protein